MDTETQAKMITVEIVRNRSGSVDEESAAFPTVEEARQWADTMRLHYGYRRAYIDGVEYNGKGD